MYQARFSGGHQSAVFDPAAQEQTVARMELEQALRQAVAQNQLRVHYQPQINMRTGELVGCEALVRWEHPQRGLLMPADFIGLAEEISLISAIDLWVLERACCQLETWRRLPGAGTLKMSVNFSAQHLPHRGLKEGVERLLLAHRLPPEALCLELTESVLDEDVQARIGLMEELRSIGIGLHMDDFGSGYSSFKQLYELPFDTLKIDRSFMEKVLEDAKARKIVEGILGLTHLIGLKVVAEGVEDERQAESCCGRWAATSDRAFCTIVRSTNSSLPPGISPLLPYVHTPPLPEADRLPASLRSQDFWRGTVCYRHRAPLRMHHSC